MIKPAFGYKMHLMKHTMSELELFFMHQAHSSNQGFPLFGFVA
jgi:hypothetical protein